MNKDKLLRGFILSTMIGLYVIVSLISTLHVIEFFEMSNPRWLAVSLAVAFEIGAAASLASIIILDKTNKTLVWGLFILLTAMQMQGNMFYAYTNLENFSDWIDLFGLQEEELITQKRILSLVSGAILPIIALGFIKSLVDYIRPATHIIAEPELKVHTKPEIGPTPKDQTETATIESALNPTLDVLVEPLPKPLLEPLTEPTTKIQAETEPESAKVNTSKVGSVTVEPMITQPAKKHFYKP